MWESPLELVHQFQAGRCRTADDDSEASQVVLLDHRMLCQQQQDGRYDVQRGCLEQNKSEV